MAKTVYRDGAFIVTEAVIATPRRFYPVANTVASIRRDPLWTALGVAGFGAACLAVYGDLRYGPEKVGIGLVCGLGLIVGQAFSILRIDAIGHRRALIIARTGRVRRLYEAIRAVRTADGAAAETADE